MNPHLIDLESLFDSLLTSAAPEGVTAIQDQHADSFQEIPFVAWTAINQGQYGFGLWNAMLTLTVIAHPLDMSQICADLYAAIRMWEVPGEGVMPGVAAINTVTDAGVFDRVNEINLPGKHLSQAVASFRFTVQDMS